MPRSGGVALLLLAAILTQSGKGRARNGVPQEQSESSHLVSRRTYAPGDFRQSRLDRLSGGLAQQFPYRMATDSKGRILVTDFGLSVVHVFDTRQGTRWQIRGDPHHRLGRPRYIVVDADDNIYVTDVWLSAVVVFQPDGRFKQTIGAGVFKVPTGLSVDTQNRKLYVADWWKGEILSFDLGGNLLQSFGSAGRGPGQLSGPTDVVLHGDTLVVLDADNSRFQLFDLQGNFRGTWPFGFNRTPVSFAFDAADHLYYVDLDSGGLVATNPQGKVLARFDPQRRFGQWIPRPSGPNFTCVEVNAQGEVLALRPNFHIEVIELSRDGSTQSIEEPVRPL